MGPLGTGGATASSMRYATSCDKYHSPGRIYKYSPIVFLACRRPQLSSNGTPNFVVAEQTTRQHLLSQFVVQAVSQHVERSRSMPSLSVRRRAQSPCAPRAPTRCVCRRFGDQPGHTLGHADRVIVRSVRRHVSESASACRVSIRGSCFGDEGYPN